MTGDDLDRPSGKRDRLARMLRVVTVLRGHPDGIRPSEIAPCSTRVTTSCPTTSAKVLGRYLRASTR